MMNIQLDRPIILVSGTTEWQGGSVARQLLARGRFSVRVMASDPNADGARALRHAGAEIVAGVPGELNSVREALAGCYAAFASLGSGGMEAEDSRRSLNLLDAAADAGVGYLVLGAFAAPVGAAAEGVAIPEVQNRLEPYARSLQIGLTTVTAGEYYERIHQIIAEGIGAAARERLGSSREDGRVGGVAAADVPRAVAALFERRSHQHLARLHLAGDLLTPWEYAVRMTPLLTDSVNSGSLPARGYGLRDGWNEPTAFEAAAHDEDVARTRELFPAVDDFERWLVRRAQSSQGFRQPLAGGHARAAV